MDNIMSIEFLYKKRTFYALVRPKTRDGQTAYHVTIMNGELERLLFGQHILVDEKSFVRSQQEILNSEVAELRRCVATALWQRLREDPVSNYEKYEEPYEH